MKHKQTLIFLILLLISVNFSYAGNVTITLVGNDPLTVNVKGTTVDEEAAGLSIFIYFNSSSPADATTNLIASNVNSTFLTSTFGWNIFETKLIETGSWLKDGVTYTSRLNYANSNIITGNNDIWPTGGVNVLILDFDPGGPGKAYIELNGADGVPDYSTTAHVVTFVNQTVTPLPVELKSFQVDAIEGTKAQLKWTTATEVDNYGFEIERSVVSESKDALANWAKVAFVEGNGNSNSQKNYSYTDNNLVGGSKFKYRLKQIDNDGKFEYSDAVEVEVLPTKYELMQNYPNPFNPTTKIKFSIPEDAKVSINIFNLLGEKVTTLLNEDLKAGFHQVQFNANSNSSGFASGIYLYSIETKNFKAVKKLILMK